MIKRAKLGIALATVAALGIASGSAWATKTECGRVGTWLGTAGGLTWLGTDTPGTSATTGQMSLEWVAITPNFFNYTANHLTAGKGVWEKVTPREYEFSWVAYGVNTSSTSQTPIYKIRVSGVILHEDCDFANISYTTEFFIPANNPTPIVAPGVPATETRFLLP